MPKGSDNSPGPPVAHPKASGLEAVIAQAVKDELRRQSGGGGDDGGLEGRVTSVESKLTVIEKTMVTGEQLQRELGDLKTQISKVPFEVIKWLLGLGIGIVGLTLAVMKYLG